MSRLITIVALLGAGLPAPVGPFALGCEAGAQSASTQDTWQKEFDAICCKTQDAMSFSEEELGLLISGCDALQPRMDKLDETRKKVYAGRLHSCRGVYQYALDWKRTANEQNLSNGQSTPAQDAGQKELDAICAKTQIARTLSVEELASLISRCDALQPQIEKLDETPKKLYEGRLRTCRNVYASMLDAKQAEKN